MPGAPLSLPPAASAAAWNASTAARSAAVKATCVAPRSGFELIQKSGIPSPVPKPAAPGNSICTE